MDLNRITKFESLHSQRKLTGGRELWDTEIHSRQRRLSLRLISHFHG